MTKKNSYRQQLSINFLILFTLFSIIVLIFQNQREKRYKRELLENTLNTYSSQINNYINKYHLDTDEEYEKLKSYTTLITHKDLRISVISKQGKVLYDTRIDSTERMDNHLERPEIKNCKPNNASSSIRFSQSLNKDFFYLAHVYPQYYIRTALPYNASIVKELRVDDIFLYFMLLLFVVSFLLIYYISGQMGKSIAQLRDFTLALVNEKEIPQNLNFPNNELGEISNQLIRLFEREKKSNAALSAEKEKLFKHLKIEQSGLAFFNQKRETILGNSHFLILLNMISEIPIKDATAVFSIPELSPVVRFIKRSAKGKKIQQDYSKEQLIVHKNGKYISVQAVVFKDGTFEIVLHNITKLERSKKLKRELTANIAHELKTPVAAVQGYIETILDNPLIDEKIRTTFLSKAFKQVHRLSDLITDLSTLSKIEESEENLSRDKVMIKSCIDSVVQDLEIAFQENNARINNIIPPSTILYGDRGLIYSVFRNLIENSIKYGGDAVVINITLQSEDQNLLYISFCDSGPGIPDHHLQRIFERFYRIDEGRSRKVGGTGLGLSIVKNAVQLHGGSITAKNRLEGGLEYIITFRR